MKRNKRDDERKEGERTSNLHSPSKSYKHWKDLVDTNETWEL